MEKKKKFIITVSCIFIFVLISISLIVISIKINDNVYNNIYINGHDISGYTYDEVKELIISFNDELTSSKLHIYQDDAMRVTITPEDLDLNINISETILACFAAGRDEDELSNIINVLKNNIFKKDIEIIYDYDLVKLDEVIRNIDLTIEDRYLDDMYFLDRPNNKIVLTKGKTGNAINYEKEKESIFNSITNIQDNYSLDIYTKVPDQISAQIIYELANVEAKDATFDEINRVLINEIVGYRTDKDIVTAFVNNFYSSSAVESELNLTPINPTITTVDLSYKLFEDKVASFTTYFNPNEYNRSNNIKIGLSYIDEVIILPGEEFSFNNTVGNVTKEQGYLPAGTFKAGTIVNETGGGICQVSSSLYNTALLANLEITMRYAHGLPVGYVLPSRDATIYTGVLDFKFKNTRNNAIKIVTTYDPSGSLNISMYGMKEEIEYEIEIESVVTSTLYPSTKYIYDDTLEKGKEIVVSNGSNGKISEAYIVKKLDGEIVSRELLSQDKYSPQNKIVKIGTKE